MFFVYIKPKSRILLKKTKPACSIATFIEGEYKEQVEIWFARDLQAVLGYSRWENFQTAIKRAVESCHSQGINIDDHFREVTKTITLGNGGVREVQDYMLTRYACYLIAQNGDPRKEQIAFAQSYFAVQTRKAELIEERLKHLSRLETRDKLRASEKHYTLFTISTLIPRAFVYSFLQIYHKVSIIGS